MEIYIHLIKILPIDINCSLIKQTLFNFLTEDDKEKCEGPFSTEECLKALKEKMKNNKTPGLDGSPLNLMFLKLE